MRVLGLETSCDDTAAGVYDDARGLLGHVRASQVEIHRPHGGVVPELAARDHVRKLTPLVREALAVADSAPDQIDGVAYTAGPGLIGALLVAAAVGRALAFAWGVPAIGIHHLEGHLLSPQLETAIPYPFVALLVSGGHTMLVDVAAPGDYRILGSTLDDAVGEAFDKTAKRLGLDYPGGPAIAAAAAHGRPSRFRFPRPMTDRPGLDFSFSGLKTSVSQCVADLPQPLDSGTVAAIAAGFEDAAVDTLLIKTKRAWLATGRRRVVVAGGVGANRILRERLQALGEQHQVSVYFPRQEFCTDNGAMIAYAGCLRLRSAAAGNGDDDLAIDAKARWPLSTLPPLTT